MISKEGEGYQQVFERLTVMLEQMLIEEGMGVWVGEGRTSLGGEVVRRWTHMVDGKPSESLQITYKDDRANAAP